MSTFYDSSKRMEAVILVTKISTSVVAGFLDSPLRTLELTELYTRICKSAWNSILLLPHKDDYLGGFRVNLQIHLLQ